MVELTDTERMLMELMHAEDRRAAEASQLRQARFLAGVAERTGIPLPMLSIHPQTGEIFDARADENGHVADETALSLSASPERLMPTHDETPVER
jgi:hypothetical protein